MEKCDMAHNVTPLVIWIKSWEGGFSDDPDDKGGPTNNGITLATFRSVYGRNKTVDDLKRMTDTQWEHIFRTKFWDRWQADRIVDINVAFFLVQWVWGSGVHGIKIPQRILGTDVDGVVGPKTLAAVNARNGRQLFALLQQEKAAYLERCCVSTPTNRKYLIGWLKRLYSMKYGSLTLNTNPPETLTF